MIDAALWACAVAIASAMAVLAFGPEPPTGGVPLMDKGWHLAAHAALVFVLLLAAVWRPGRGPGPYPAAALVVTAALLFGGAQELIQGLDLFNDRAAELGDLAADAAGAGAGLLGWLLVRRREGRREGAARASRHRIGRG